MATLTPLSLCSSASSLAHSPKRTCIPLPFPYLGSLNLRLFNLKDGPARKNSGRSSRRFCVLAVTEGSAKKNSSKSFEEDDPSVPSWAKPDSDELPPWARNESQNESSGLQVPYGVYLLASAITAIAAIGSVFEYINQKPVFGVVASDSIFYAPLLGFFAFTGIPTSAFLWFKSVQVANKEAEEQDRRDGYL
ncbi:OLC1v1010412C1 [Oldenlandia corymbosa var. corymbosa]|uniref:OLC1v1010412C1 n=1 Tax=Oldenlandia corymbosa var. corymbosa TaxID=529605 RepID=A0AAV1DTS9_OLDCO|nr:OLC1v1010412C1 [Oldenlandia corymbosa var. corymbosa]